MPLTPGWPYKTKPILCAYKLVSVEFNYWGLQQRVELLVQEIIKGVYLRTHRQICCWIDEWIDMSLDDVIQLQKKLAESLKRANTEQKQSSIHSSKENQTTEKGKKSWNGWLRSKL